MTAGDGVDNAEDDTESKSDESVSNDSGECESDQDCGVIGGMETVMGTGRVKFRTHYLCYLSDILRYTSI